MQLEQCLLQILKNYFQKTKGEVYVIFLYSLRDHEDFGGGLGSVCSPFHFWLEKTLIFPS